MQKQAKQKQVRDKILATNDYEKMHPTQKAKLEQEAMRLPSVKGNLYSNPKFLNKSQILGRKKFIQESFRYTPLNDNLQIERSRS